MKRDLNSTFEEKYQQWKSYCARPELAEYSSDQPFIDNPQFQAIVDLGEAVIPCLIAKMRQDPDAHFLVHALERITGRRFSSAEIEIAKRKYGSPLGNQGYARMWMDWWDNKDRENQ